MIWVISSSLKENLSTTLSVCRLKGGSVLEFLKKQHWEAKNLLKSSAFSKKFGTVSPLTVVSKGFWYFSRNGSISSGTFFVQWGSHSVFQSSLGHVFLLNI